MTGLSPDLLIVGGGVIGLSIACDAAAAGLRVTLLERGRIGREASWAGAGVLPPRSWYVDDPALDWLAEQAAPQHAALSNMLRDEVGVDDEYTKCGALYDLSGEDRYAEEGIQTVARWRRLGVTVEQVGPGRVLAPDEAQVRNPRRLRGLRQLAERRGCRLVEQTAVVELLKQGDGVVGVRTAHCDYFGGAVCLAAGCWTPDLAATANTAAPGKPIRGQMLLLRPTSRLDQILHRPPWYAVPRQDGLVLVGATVEDVGFNSATTEVARDELLAAAARIDVRLADARIENRWAGLRPRGGDALPQIGWAAGVENLLVASAHHRSGLQYSPPTARLAVRLLTGQPLPPEAAAFALQRFSAASPAVV